MTSFSLSNSIFQASYVWILHSVPLIGILFWLTSVQSNHRFMYWINGIWNVHDDEQRIGSFWKAIWLWPTPPIAILLLSEIPTWMIGTHLLIGVGLGYIFQYVTLPNGKPRPIPSRIQARPMITQLTFNIQQSIRPILLMIVAYFLAFLTLRFEHWIPHLQIDLLVHGLWPIQPDHLQDKSTPSMIGWLLGAGSIWMWIWYLLIIGPSRWFTHLPIWVSCRLIHGLINAAAFKWIQSLL